MQARYCIRQSFNREDFIFGIYPRDRHVIKEHLQCVKYMFGIQNLIL